MRRTFSRVFSPIFCRVTFEFFNAESVYKYTSHVTIHTSNTLVRNKCISSSNINAISKALDIDATKIDVAGCYANRAGVCLCYTTRGNRKSPNKTRSRNILCRDTNEMQMARLCVAQTFGNTVWVSFEGWFWQLVGERRGVYTRQIEPGTWEYEREGKRERRAERAGQME